MIRLLDLVDEKRERGPSRHVVRREGWEDWIFGINNAVPGHLAVLDKEKMAELNISLDEMLESAARHRIMSYQQAIHMIIQF